MPCQTQPLPPRDLNKSRQQLTAERKEKDGAKDIASHERFLFGSRPCLGTDRGDSFFWDLASVPVQQPSGQAAGHAGLLSDHLRLSCGALPQCIDPSLSTQQVNLASSPAAGEVVSIDVWAMHRAEEEAAADAELQDAQVASAMGGGSGRNGAGRGGAAAAGRPPKPNKQLATTAAAGGNSSRGAPPAAAGGLKRGAPGAEEGVVRPGKMDLVLIERLNDSAGLDAGLAQGWTWRGGRRSCVSRRAA